MRGNISVWDNITVNVGIIGNGVQSKRIQKILKKKKLVFLYTNHQKKQIISIKRNSNILKRKK